tara:strand:+ start:6256 stop:6525 length:270 start_codon:yes stop_codon:yes gene_type:complete
MEIEFTIDENLLMRVIDETRPGAENEHKAVHSILSQLYTMSMLWRNSIDVVLTNGKHTSLDSERYQKYLDDKVSGKQVNFDANEDENQD